MIDEKRNRFEVSFEGAKIAWLCTFIKRNRFLMKTLLIILSVHQKSNSNSKSSTKYMSALHNQIKSRFFDFRDYVKMFSVFNNEFLWSKRN